MQRGQACLRREEFMLPMAGILITPTSPSGYIAITGFWQKL
ncbi:hypothetical protein [Nitrosomonas sp.]